MPRRPAVAAGYPATRRRHQSRSPGPGGVSGARSDADLWEASNGARSESSGAMKATYGEPSNGAGAGPAVQKRRGVGRKADNA